MKLKSGVRVFGIRAETLLAINIVESVFQNEKQEFVITSLMEGKHSRGSLHYSGAAFDIRTRHLSEDSINKIYKILKVSLGMDYDVIQEKTHIHIEFQPKIFYSG